LMKYPLTASVGNINTNDRADFTPYTVIHFQKEFRRVPLFLY
jgi:hypothetical protein